MDSKFNNHESPWISLAPMSWSSLTDGLRAVLYRKKEALYHQGDQSDMVFIVKSGRLRITSYREDGSEKQLFIAELGTMVGESSCLNSCPHTSSAIAIVDSWVWRIRREQLCAQMQKDWGLTQQVISLICRKKNILFQQMLDLSFSQSVQRIAQLLLNMCYQYGVICEKGMRISIRFTHQDVASMVSVSRVTVSGVFNLLTEHGLLLRQGSHFVLPNLSALQSVATGEVQLLS